MSDMLIVLQVIVVAICLDIIVALCFRKQCTERSTLLLIMIAVFGYNLVGTLTGTMERNYIHEISDILYMMAEICFFLGMWKLVGYMIDRPWSKWLMNLVTIYFSILLVIRLTNQEHFLFYKENVYMQVKPGFFSYVYMISMMLNMLAMFLVCLTVCIKRYGKIGRNERMEYRLMLIATLIPCANSIDYFLGSSNYYKIQPFGMFLESMIMLLVMSRYHFLRIVESARELVIETMDIGLVIVDRDYGYLNANTYAAKLFPELSKIERRNNILITIPEMREIFRGGETGELEKNERYYDWKKSEIYLERRQRGYVLCLYDITEQKNAINRLMEMKQQAEAECEEKGIFLANASHEIRTPMNAILGMSEVCMQKTEDQKMKNALRIMKEAGEGLLEIINGILDFSKIEAGKVEIREEVYSLEKVLVSFYEMMQERLCQKNVEFKVRIGKQVPKVLKGDEGKVRIVLMNLLSNAGKYTREGSIILKVERREEGEKRWIFFEVRDTGIGMASKDVQRIFEKYTQVGEDSEIQRAGTGLGLSITRSLVEAMEGDIQVETSLGEGSVFQVRLPMNVAEETYFDDTEFTKEWLEKYHDRKETEEISVIYPKGKALVVDDMEVNLKVAQGMLELYQVQSRGVLSGAMAVEELRQGTYDILFIDQMMPQMDGMETLRKIRELGITTPAVALTAQNIPEEIRLLKENGFDNVLVKPLERKKLEQMLEIYMRKKKQKGKVSQSRNQRDILKSYYYQVSEIAENLPQLYQEDFETFLIQVHGIKGASRNIGAVLAGNLAEQMEQEGKKGNRAYIEDQLEEFSAVLQRTLEWVKKKIEEVPVERPRKEKLEKSELVYMAERLEEFELEEAQEELEKVLQYSYSAREEELLFDLERLIVNLEYDEAVKVIREFLKEEGKEAQNERKYHKYESTGNLS